jgi:hypothetical protein
MSSSMRSRCNGQWVVWLGLVALGVAVAWGAWWLWKPGRSGTVSPPPADPPVVVKPADLPGLGYLPESTSAVLAVQLPVLMERLDPNEKDDPANALKRLGLPEKMIELLESASGVGLKEVDHLVVGISFKDRSFPPRFVIVAQTRRPYDLAALVRQTKARELRKDGRTLHVVRTSVLPEVYWWAPNNRILVATIDTGDLRLVPMQPRTGVDGLRPDMVQLIREAVVEDACAWLAASDDDWDKHLRIPTLLPFVPIFSGRTDLIRPAERLRSVTLSVSPDPERPADLRIGLKSDEATVELWNKLCERFRGEPIEVSRNAETVRIQTAFHPGRLGSLIARLLATSK